ncbi:MAG: flagellar hook capping FlgD N-terminal domain-containing protein [Planctomycetota bacterium]
MSAAISSTAGAQAASSTDRNAFADLSSDEFVNILIAELTTQDPFEPNDTAAILEQLSGLRSIESDQQLTESLESVVLQNGIASAGALIGRTVEGLSPIGDRLSGQVSSVRIVDGEAQLELDTGRRLPLSNVTRVGDVGQAGV